MSCSRKTKPQRKHRSDRMSHIADHHNNGRCGQHQTIDQARGAFAQLIAKEERAAEVSYTRDLLLSLRVECPACKVPVTTARCHVCGYFPIPLPNNAQLRKIEEESRKRRGLPLSTSLLPGAGGGIKPPVHSSSPQQLDPTDRLARLEKLVAEERDEQLVMLRQVEQLRGLLIKHDGVKQKAAVKKSRNT